ncbi:unnamed protein product [Rhizophagus irregularis]|nr:unnamed protein product [Rhizophagus irregularis]
MMDNVALRDLSALGQNNINGTNNHHEISDHEPNNYYEDMNIESILLYRNQASSRKDAITIVDHLQNNL